MPNPKAKFAIVLHIYYLDVAERLLQQLDWLLREDFALWVTVPPEQRQKAEQLLERYQPSAIIRSFDNIGMDVWPFLRLLPELVEHDYTAVLKLHTKRGSDAYSRVWGRVLTDTMCQESLLSFTMQAFKHHPDLDFVGLAPFFLSARKLALSNQPQIQTLTVEIPELAEMPDNWGFFAGTVFVARPERLLPLARWAAQNKHRFATDYKSDGLWEHAIERVFPLLARRDIPSIALVHESVNSGNYVLQRLAVDSSFSQAYTRRLAAQLDTLEEDHAYLSRCQLLDTANYTLEGEVEGEPDLYRHYLLIGQFDHRRVVSQAWALKQQNEYELPWDKWAKRAREPDLVSVVIPIFNQPVLTEQCLRSLFSARTIVRFEVLCIDNGSDPDTQTVLARLADEFADICVVRNSTNLNFALGCNIGFGASRGERVVFLNNDTQVSDGWLDHLIRRLDQGDCYAVQPQLRYPDGNLQCMGVVFSDKSTLGYPIYAGMKPEACHADKPRMFKALTAACLMLKASDFVAAKGFDALYINGQEDVDLCLRLHESTGKLGAYVPESLVIHHEFKTKGRGRWITQNRRIFVHRWEGKIASDDKRYYHDDGFEISDWVPDSANKDLALRVYRPTLTRQAVLAVANRYALGGDFPAALQAYMDARKGLGSDFPSLHLNFDIIRRRWLMSRSNKKPKVVVCCWELSHNPAGRAMTLAEAWQPLAEVAIVGCIIATFGRTLWEPVTKSAIPCHSFVVEDHSTFVYDAFRLVSQHPADLVHLSKPRMNNVIFGWLYQLIWGARVIMDVDDEELGFARADKALDPFEYIRIHGDLPPPKSIRSQASTQLAVGMVHQFDAVTVSNSALQRRYGGQIIPHVRPLDRFQPSEEKRSASRAEFGIPEDKRVVLFYGTPRMHKGVAETAQALAALGRDDVCYVIAGGEPEPALRTRLEAIRGVDYIFLGPQPYERTADVVAIGDICILLQDTESEVAQFQLPAKLMDALGMGLTVFAQVTPALEELASKGAFISVTRNNLVDKLRAWFESESTEQAQQGRAVFEAELTVEATAPILRDILADDSRRRAMSLRWEGQLERIFQHKLPLGVPLPQK